MTNRTPAVLLGACVLLLARAAAASETGAGSRSDGPAAAGQGASDLDSPAASPPPPPQQQPSFPPAPSENGGLAPPASVASVKPALQIAEGDGGGSTSTSTSTVRPLLSVGIGMGISADSAGLVEGRTVEIPAFQVQIGAGEASPLGFELRLFSNQASGRFHHRASAATPGGVVPADAPVDRLALDALLAWHPFHHLSERRLAGVGASWPERVAGSFTVNLGVAAETGSVGPPSVLRLGPVVGVHFDLPLLPASTSTDLRIRLTGRRMFGRNRQAGAVTVTDSKAEVFAGLVLVF